MRIRSRSERRKQAYCEKVLVKKNEAKDTPFETRILKIFSPTGVVHNARSEGRTLTRSRLDPCIELHSKRWLLMLTGRSVYWLEATIMLGLRLGRHRFVSLRRVVES